MASLRRLLSSPQLASRARERVELSIQGYESDPRELWEIDAVRNFLSGLDDDFPYWFWFLDKSAAFLQVIVFRHAHVERVGLGQIRYTPHSVADLAGDWWIPKMLEVAEYTNSEETVREELSERAATFILRGRAPFVRAP